MNEINRLLEYESESSSLDYKFKSYDLSDKLKKYEFLKDVSSMANTLSDQDKYIVIGVKEQNGIASEFQNVEEKFDEANYQQYLYSNIEPAINFEYKQIIFKGFKLYYFRIHNNIDRPYLFKKKVNSGTQTKFNPGDGVIRIGTSTRRLTRTDLDLIFQRKYEVEDRRTDLEVEVVIKKLSDRVINFDKLRYIDIVVTNKSHKSIGFDAEMKIFNNGRQTIFTKKAIKENFAIPKQGNIYDIQHFHSPQIPNFEIDVEETQDFSRIERTKNRGQQYSITIPQGSYYENIFLQEFIINPNVEDLIKGEIILRSDDFIEGPLIIPFKKEITNA